MMQQLRQSTKIVMILVTISFIGLMVFEWGMDLSGRANMAGPTSALGSIDGDDISIEEYQSQYQILYEQAQRQSPEGNLTPDQVRAIEDQAWENVVRLTLLRQEAARREIGVTDGELMEFIRSNPPPDIVNLPAFQTEGQFDLQKYHQALAEPTLAATWAEYEAQLRRTLPLQKLQEQVVAGVTVTDAELLDAFKAANERARIAYLHLDPDSLVPEGTVSVSDEEVREFYEENSERWRRAPSARISYVEFQSEVTAGDSAAAHARADSLAALAAQPDTDFAELAQDASGDPVTRQAGGDLGWFRPSTMAPAFEAAVNQLEPGEVSEAVLTNFGWHVIKVENRQSETDQPRTWARHILIPIEPSPESRRATRDSAQAFARAASEGPESFAQAAAEYGLEVQETPLFEEGIVVPGIGVAPVVAEFAFSNTPGSTSGALEQNAAIYVVRLEQRFPAGYVSLAAVEDEIRSELMERARLEAVRERAPEITEMVRQFGLDGAAERLGLTVVATEPFTRTNNVPGIGSGTPVAGAAFGLAQGQTAGPIETSRGLYYIRLLEKQPYDPQVFERSKAELRQQLRLAQMQNTFDAWFENLRERADIEDNRARLAEG